MRWLKPNLKSIHSLLGQAGLAKSGAQGGLEDIRSAMLAATPTAPAGKAHAVFHQIHHAGSVEALWYARSDLMAAIAAERGEAFAQQQIAAISRLFDGLLPRSQRYRQPAPGRRAAGSRRDDPPA